MGNELKQGVILYAEKNRQKQGGRLAYTAVCAVDSMSIHLMSLVWEIQFPAATQKLVMLKLADHASDDGASVFPANETLAYQIGCEKRTIQRCVKALESVGMIKCLHKGGNGPGDTNRWVIDVDLLTQLALRQLHLDGKVDCLSVVENKGDILTPSALVRVTRTLKRVTPRTPKGDVGVTQTTINHQLEPSDAQARARDGSRSLSAVKNRACFELTPGDVQWSAWIKQIEQDGRDDLVQAAKQNAKISVSRKWPDGSGLEGLISAGKINFTNRMMGEANE